MTVWVMRFQVVLEGLRENAAEGNYQCSRLVLTLMKNKGEDPRWVTAVVVLQPGAQVSESDILNAVRSRLARYKLPKRILLVAELPRNTMGKVQKNVLRATHDSLYVK